MTIAVRSKHKLNVFLSPERNKPNKRQAKMSTKRKKNVYRGRFLYFISFIRRLFFLTPSAFGLSDQHAADHHRNKHDWRESYEYAIVQTYPAPGLLKKTKKQETQPTHKKKTPTRIYISGISIKRDRKGMIIN